MSVRQPRGRTQGLSHANPHSSAHLSPADFDRTPAGVLQDRLNRDADELGENLIQFPKEMVLKMTWIGCNLFLVFQQSPRNFFMLACCPVLLMTLFQYFTFKVFRRCNEIARKVEEEGVSTTSEVLRQIKTVRQFATEQRAAASYARRSLARDIIGEGIFTLKRVLEALVWCVFDSGIALTILLGFPYVASGAMTSGQLIDCFIKLNFHINFSLRELLEKIPRMARMLEPIGRICDLLKSEPKLEPSVESASHIDCSTAAELNELLGLCEVSDDAHGDTRTHMASGKLSRVALGAQLKHLSTSDHQYLAVQDWHALDLSVLTYPIRAVFSTKLRPTRFRGKIEFRNVHFACACAPS